MPTTFQEIPRKRPSTPLLDRAATPDGLRRLGEAELETLADELRLELLYTVGQTGGHFGAGLGVIELTIALHYVFDTPDDQLVWDVGHQAYPHKILTGRSERMTTLRPKDGIAPSRAAPKANTTPSASATPAPPSAPPWAWRLPPGSRQRAQGDRHHRRRQRSPPAWPSRP